MDILGVHFELVHLVQAVVAIVALWAYQTLTLLACDSLNELSAAHSALLMSFVSRHVKRFSSDLGKPTVYRMGEKEYCEKVDKWLHQMETGSECRLDCESSGIRLAVLVETALIFITPFFFPFAVVSGRGSSKYEQRVSTTARRQVDFAFIVSTVIVALGLLLVAITMADKHSSFAIILGIVVGVTVLVGPVALVDLIRQQQYWKAYWNGWLFEIMAAAEQSNNQGLFLKALTLRNEVSSHPDVPMPGNAGFYTAVFAVIQLAVYWAFQILGHT